MAKTTTEYGFSVVKQADGTVLVFDGHGVNELFPNIFEARRAIDRYKRLPWNVSGLGRSTFSDPSVG